MPSPPDARFSRLFLGILVPLSPDTRPSPISTSPAPPVLGTAAAAAALLAPPLLVVGVRLLHEDSLAVPHLEARKQGPDLDDILSLSLSLPFLCHLLFLLLRGGGSGGGSGGTADGVPRERELHEGLEGLSQALQPDPLVDAVVPQIERAQGDVLAEAGGDLGDEVVRRPEFFKPTFFFFRWANVGGSNQ